MCIGITYLKKTLNAGDGACVHQGLILLQEKFQNIINDLRH